MQDYLKELLIKRNLINVLVLAILVLAVPLTINLVRQKQILFSKAATDTVQLVDNSCTTTQNNKKVLTCPTLTLNFVAPSEVDVIASQGLVSTAYAATSCDLAYDGQTLSGQDSSVVSSFNAAYGDQASAEWIREHNIALSQNSPKATDNQALFDQLCPIIYSFYGTYGSNAPSEWVKQHNAEIGPSPSPSPTSAPTAPPVASCPVTASCCSTSLQKCGTGPTFDNKSKDTSCPVGFQWCYSGYCINENYDGKGTTGSCTPVVPPAPPAPTKPNATVTVSPTTNTKTNNTWQAMSVSVITDASVSWTAYYYNPGTCTPASCPLEGWTTIGNGVGSQSITWPSAQILNVNPLGAHSIGIITKDSKGFTQVIAIADATFNEGSIASPTPTPIPTQNFTKVRYGENASDLTNPNARHEISYVRGGVKVDIALSNPAPGTKFIYAQFIDDKGAVVNGFPHPFQIDLVGPTPIVSGFACEVNIASSAIPNSPASDLLFTFQGVNFGSQEGSINLVSSGTVAIESWTDSKVVGRLANPPASSTATGTRYVATLTTKAGQKSTEQQCLVGITQISLGAQLFCRTQRNFDQDNVDLVLINDKDRTQKSTEKVTIDMDGNISSIKTKLRAGDNYIACIKAPLSLRKCSASFTASSGTNNLTLNLPIGDYNGDGSINSVDASLLKNQWGPVNSNKNCDVNRDGFCNSFEWSCMLHDFNSSNQAIP